LYIRARVISIGVKLGKPKYLVPLLDDHTVNRIVKLYSEQLGDQWLIDTQLEQWKKERLTQFQENEVDRLIK